METVKEIIEEYGNEKGDGMLKSKEVRTECEEE